MFDQFIKIYETFRQNGLKNPLLETLQIFDIYAKRQLRKIDESLKKELTIDIAQMADERKQGIPLEYILGVSPFMGALFHCAKDALIPREETELLAKTALEYVHQKQSNGESLTVIDMGTGCGNIAVTLALNSKSTTVIASDLKPETVDIARKNVERHHLQERVLLYNGDLFSPIYGLGYEKKVDIVVCNPPYIPTTSLKKMPAGIIDNEPVEAFDAGPFGIDFFRRLINDSVLFLKPGGILVFEIGSGQENLVARLFKKNPGYKDLRYVDDGEQVRVVSAVCDLAE